MQDNIKDVSVEILGVIKRHPACDPRKEWGIETAIQGLMVSLASTLSIILNSIPEGEKRKREKEKMLEMLPKSMDLYFKQLFSL
ncbi:MAG: hypothetical protein K2G69_09650 [Muribaculaceae bacterium]|nr:hypothetical protein [Muribaculaceae bacterium]